MVDVKVVAPEARGEEVDYLPVSGLSARRDARVADQLRHSAPGVSHNQRRVPSFKQEVMRRSYKNRRAARFRGLVEGEKDAA